MKIDCTNSTHVLCHHHNNMPSHNQQQQQQQVSQFKYVPFANLDAKSQHEMVRDCHYNVPFGYLDHKKVFHAFVNIDVDEHGEYVYHEYGNKYSVAQLIVKQKQVPVEEWMDHVVVVNQYGKTMPLKKVQVRVRRDYGTKKKNRDVSSADTEE